MRAKKIKVSITAFCDINDTRLERSLNLLKSFDNIKYRKVLPELSFLGRFHNKCKYYNNKQIIMANKEFAYINMIPVYPVKLFALDVFKKATGVSQVIIVRERIS